MAGAYRFKEINQISPISNRVVRIDLSKTKFDISQIASFISQLELIEEYYDFYALDFDSFPVKFTFEKLIGKSRRFQRIIKNSFDKQIDSVYDFTEDGRIIDSIKLTYKLNLQEINKVKKDLVLLKKFVQNTSPELIDSYNEIDSKTLTEEARKNEKLDFFELEKIKSILINIKSSKSEIQGILHDIAFLTFIERPIFLVPEEAGYATLYESIDYTTAVKVLHRIGIEKTDDRIINLSGEFFLNLDEESLNLINDLFPFIIRTAGINRIEFENSTFENSNSGSGKHLYDLDFGSHPKRKTKIGVIDTWAKDELSEITNGIVEINNFPLSTGLTPDYAHGTQVVTLASFSSLFQTNELLQDKLGVFPIKHFGIMGGRKSFMPFITFLQKIRNIIELNYQEIKIWNLSIDIKRISQNQEDSRKIISELGRIFDKIQVEFDVIFIISVGNSKVISPGADSLMALSVGACYLNDQNKIKESSYSGTDYVFRRLKKPDVHDFGNDFSEKNDSKNTLNMIDDSLFVDVETDQEGTSFSAPLMARKCAYLLEKFDLSIEELRATINVLSELSNNSEDGIKIVDPFLINDESSDYLFGWVRGEINSKDNFSEKIVLPTKVKDKKMYKDFHLLMATSHQIYPEQRWGDEYVGTEIEFKINGKNKNDGKSLRALLKKTENNVIEQTEVQLINEWGKYNPNSLLIDKDFSISGDRYRDTFQLEKDSLRMFVRRIDMFSSSKSYKYGSCIVVKGMNKNSLKNFEIENQEIIEKIYNPISVEIKEKVKA